MVKPETKKRLFLELTLPVSYVQQNTFKVTNLITHQLHINDNEKPRPFSLMMSNTTTVLFINDVFIMRNNRNGILAYLANYI